MSNRAGPSDWHVDQIFKETVLDILFVGNSAIATAIDHAELRREMTALGSAAAHEIEAAPARARSRFTDNK